MSSNQRKETPNIMAELATGKPEPESQQASKPVKRQAGRPAARPAGKRPAPPDQVTNSHLDPEKVKATFYLSSAGMEALEASWMQLRQQAGAARGQVSRSGLVEVALLRLQDELRREKVAAEILQAILRVE